MKRNLKPAIVVASALLGSCVLIAWPMGFLAFHVFRSNSTPDHATLVLPDGRHAIEHARVRLPRICAEYSREVTYVTSGVRGATTPLEVDGCGGYPVNCYLIETPRGPLLRLDDAVSEHLLDMTTQTTYAIIRVRGTPYIGELRDERASAGWSMSNNDPSTLSVTIGDVRAKPMAELTQDATEVYLGRFDGRTGHLRFTPASESPEIAIDRPFGR